MTCDESKPWKNLIFTQLIKLQWWGPKGEERHLGPDPTVNLFLNASVSTLALVATVVCHYFQFVAQMMQWFTMTDRLNVCSLAFSPGEQLTSMKIYIGEGEWSQ